MCFVPGTIKRGTQKNNPGIVYGVVACRDEVVLRPKACSSDDDNVARRSRWLPWDVERMVHVVHPRVWPAKVVVDYAYPWF